MKKNYWKEGKIKIKSLYKNIYFYNVPQPLYKWNEYYKLTKFHLINLMNKKYLI